jgi:hypothetical protein
LFHHVWVSLHSIHVHCHLFTSINLHPTLLYTLNSLIAHAQ